MRYRKEEHSEKNLLNWCKENNRTNLLNEWCYEKNNLLDVVDVEPGSEKRVWWKCEYGHEWKAQINSRTRMNTGCPYCSGRLVISGVNDLQTLRPEIAKEWHPTMNGNLKPSDVMSSSNKRAWWLCPNNHSYDARIGNRTQLNRGCPYCSGNKTLDGYNDFKTWCIDNGRAGLLDEWDYEKNEIKPSQISPKNNRKVWWKCSLGHEWDCSIGSRTSTQRPSGCPYCSNPPKRVLVGFNDFETWCIKNKKKKLLKEWDVERNAGTTPRDITFGTGKRFWWKCDRGHEWRVAPSNRVQGTGCPVCSRTQTSFPEQAIAYYLSKSFKVLQRYRVKGYEIDVFLEDYNIGVEYDGKFYHKEDSIIRETKKNEFFESRGTRIIHVKEHDNKNVIEDTTIFFIPIKSNYLDNSFNAMLNTLATLLERLTGVTTNKDIDIIRDELSIREHYASVMRKNSFAEVFPNLVSEWDIEKNKGMTPDSFSAFSQIKVWWKCKKGHSWQSVISSRSRLGCPYCAGQRTIAGENDFESWCLTNNPELLKEWDYDKNPVKPTEVSKTSNQKMWWICAKGHEWQAVIANRVHGTRCPICYTGNDTVRRQTSLARWCKENDYEHLLSEWDYQKNDSDTPDTVSKGSHKKVWWKCSEGHEWEAQIKSRTYNHGCPYCSGTYKRTQVGKNDLVTWCRNNNKLYILEEWDYESNDNLLPEMFTYGSHKRINWKCSNDHKWSAVIKDRTKMKGNMCPVCKMR